MKTSLKAYDLFLAECRRIGDLSHPRSPLTKPRIVEEKQPNYIRHRAERLCRVDNVPEGGYPIPRRMEDSNWTLQGEELNHAGIKRQRTFRDQSTNTEPYMNQHVRPPGEKSYKHGMKCNICNKLLHSDMKRHVNIVHRGLKPYSCSVCSRNFAVKSNMTSHEQRGKCSPVGH